MKGKERMLEEDGEDKGKKYVGTKPFSQRVNTSTPPPLGGDVLNIERRAGTYEFRQIVRAGISYENTCAKLWRRTDVGSRHPLMPRIQAALKIKVGTPNCRVETQ